MFYKVAGVFSKDDIKFSKLRKALDNTEAIFTKELLTVRKHAQKFEEYLYLRLNSNQVDESLYHEARRGLRKWTEATKFFRKQKFLRNEIALCMKYLEKSAASLTFLEPKDDALSRLQYIVKLEGKFQGPLPIDLVPLAAKEGEVEQKDFNKLIEWISNFKRVWPVHKFLASIFSYIDGTDIVSFEIKCLENQCNIFKQSDPKHILWRQTLHPGTKLDQYTLGKQIGVKVGGSDEQIFFEILEHPDKLMMISTNRSLLAIKKEWAQRGCRGLRAQDYQFIDPKGRYALVEKFNLKISDLTWKSEDKLEEEDIRMATPIANYIRWMLDNNLAVSCLNAENILFDSNGTLRSVKNQERSSVNFNFPACENFLLDVSKENFEVFKYLFHHSGLSDTKFTAFYRKAVSEALYNGMPNIPNVGASRFICTKKDIEKGTELCDRVIRIQNRFLAEYKINKEELAKVMNAVYLKLETASLLWPTYEDDVRSHLEVEYAHLRRFIHT